MSLRSPVSSPKEVGMMNANNMRANAAICLALAEKAISEPARLRYMRMASGWHDLAENQDWLDGTHSRTPSLQPELDTC
jgi:hypothetical protein